MNPILVALQQALEQLVSIAGAAVADWLVNLFKKHVMPHGQFQAMDKTQLRATSRQWVKDMLAEFGQVLIAKNVLPGWLQAFLPLFEQAVEQALDGALDAAGL